MQILMFKHTFHEICCLPDAGSMPGQRRRWLNPYHAKLIYLNFHPLEIVSRYRDPQLQVMKITHICLI